MARQMPTGFPGASVPFFSMFTDPRMSRFLTPQARRYATELAVLSGAFTPSATYNFDVSTGQGMLPHVQTSPGVYEADPRVQRFQSDTINQLLKGSTEPQTITNPKVKRPKTTQGGFSRTGGGLTGVFLA